MNSQNIASVGYISRINKNQLILLGNFYSSKRYFCVQNAVKIYSFISIKTSLLFQGGVVLNNQKGSSIQPKITSSMVP